MVITRRGTSTLTLIDDNFSPEEAEAAEDNSIEGDAAKEISILKRTVKSLKDELIREREISDHLRYLLSLNPRKGPVPREDDKHDDSWGDDSQPIPPGQVPPKGDVDNESINSDSADKDADSKSPDDEGRGKKDDSLAEIHPRCSSPSAKLTWILNAFKNLPDNRDTILIGDSNFHCIKGELDPIKKNTVVRAISGLCVVGAAQALKKYRYKYPNIKKIVLSLGVNDHLHAVEHCPADWDVHFDTLICEIKRIFHKAKIHFVLPFRGLSKVPEEHGSKIYEMLKVRYPFVRKHSAPSMSNKVQRDGIHVDKEGAKSLRAFLVSKFTSYKPPESQVSPRPNNLMVNDERERGSGDLGQTPWSSLGADVYSYNNRPPPPVNRYNGMGRSEDVDAQFPPLCDRNELYGPQRMFQGQQRNYIRDLSEAMASMLFAHRNRWVN